MTGDRATQIGIDRQVRLDWLERTSSLVLAGNTPKDIKAILQNDLCAAFRSGKTDKRGSLDKTITILMKVWLTTPQEYAALRITGLELLKRLQSRHRMAVHWGMVMAIYPFWASVASQVGRLLKLQGSAVASQVQRRMREQYGERETVSRRTRYVLRSFVDWEVLRQTSVVGVYEQLPPIAIAERELAAWLIETVVLSRSNGPMPLKNLIESTSLFPFRFTSQVSSEDIILATSRLDILRHNMNEELVVLKSPQARG